MRTRRDPYFLYGASNLGSLIALLSYPLLLEPTIGLTAQSKVLERRLRRPRRDDRHLRGSLLLLNRAPPRRAQRRRRADVAARSPGRSGSPGSRSPSSRPASSSR